MCIILLLRECHKQSICRALGTLVCSLILAVVAFARKSDERLGQSDIVQVTNLVRIRRLKGILFSLHTYREKDALLLWQSLGLTAFLFRHPPQGKILLSFFSYYIYYSE